MPHFVHTRLPAGPQSSLPKQQLVIDREGWPPFPPPQPISDDTKQLHQTLRSSPPPPPLASGTAVGGLTEALQDLRTADRRRAYFRDASHRRELIFGPEVRHTLLAPVKPVFLLT
jgi:hypothetical protein